MAYRASNVKRLQQTRPNTAAAPITPNPQSGTQIKTPTVGGLFNAPMNQEGLRTNQMIGNMGDSLFQAGQAAMKKRKQANQLFEITNKSSNFEIGAIDLENEIKSKVVSQEIPPNKMEEAYTAGLEKLRSGLTEGVTDPIVLAGVNKAIQSYVGKNYGKFAEMAFKAENESGLQTFYKNVRNKLSKQLGNGKADLESFTGIIKGLEEEKNAFVMAGIESSKDMTKNIDAILKDVYQKELLDYSNVKELEGMRNNRKFNWVDKASIDSRIKEINDQKKQSIEALEYQISVSGERTKKLENNVRADLNILWGNGDFVSLDPAKRNYATGILNKAVRQGVVTDNEARTLQTQKPPLGREGRIVAKTKKLMTDWLNSEFGEGDLPTATELRKQEEQFRQFAEIIEGLGGQKVKTSDIANKATQRGLPQETISKTLPLLIKPSMTGRSVLDLEEHADKTAALEDSLFTLKTGKPPAERPAKDTLDPDLESMDKKAEEEIPPSASNDLPLTELNYQQDNIEFYKEAEQEVDRLIARQGLEMSPEKRIEAINKLAKTRKDKFYEGSQHDFGGGQTAFDLTNESEEREAPELVKEEGKAKEDVEENYQGFINPNQSQAPRELPEIQIEDLAKQIIKEKDFELSPDHLGPDKKLGLSKEAQTEKAARVYIREQLKANPMAFDRIVKDGSVVLNKDFEGVDYDKVTSNYDLSSKEQALLGGRRKKLRGQTLAPSKNQILGWADESQTGLNIARFNRAVTMPSVVKAILEIETSGGKEYKAESEAGAVGLMQIMPGTAALIAKQTEWTKEQILNDPYVNVLAGVWLLRDNFKNAKALSARQLRSKTKATDEQAFWMAIAGYNSKPSRVLVNVQKKGKDVEKFILGDFADETKDYLRKVNRLLDLGKRLGKLSKGE